VPEQDEKSPLAKAVETALVGANAFIQWKGTDVCMDVHCPCGTHSHIDDEFVYYVRCPGCGVAYKVGDTVTLTPMTNDELDRAPGGCGIKEPK
jgi:hypothetical protein